MSHDISLLIAQNEKEQWPFPKFFDALKKIGVMEYEVDVASCDRIYFINNGDVWYEPVPEEFTAPHINEFFNQEVLLHALDRRRKNETSYLQCLYEMAAAGVNNYTVDMDQRTVTYYGCDPESFYVQQVPVYQ